MQDLYSAATKKIPGKTFAQIWEEQNLDIPFERSKKMLLKATELNHPDPNAPLALTTDASSARRKSGATCPGRLEALRILEPPLTGG